jgi:hypothetical protein
MSTINTNYNFRTGYEQQITDAQTEQTNAQNALTDAQKDLLNELNTSGLMRDGKPLVLNSLKEWKAVLENPNITLQHASGDENQLNSARISGLASCSAALTAMEPLFKDVDNAAAKLAALQLVHSQAFEPLQAMQKLLQNGDIEGATIALQTSRVRVLDDQLKGRIASLQQRNADIAALNTKLADAQKELAGDKDNADKQKKVADFKNQIDKLNSESQLDMIGIQQLVNKRNEAFDLLTNLLNKFQKTFDNITSNIR